MQHFQMHAGDKKLYFDSFFFYFYFFPKFVSKGPIVEKCALVKIITWHQTGDEPLPAPMLTKIHGAFWFHWASVC